MHDGVARISVGKGYSGKGLGRNNPEMQQVANVGPIPTGQYTIGPLFDHQHGKGPKAMRLTPAAENEMFGRSAFMIHGDNNTHTASEGCIILGRALREVIGENPDKELLVVVDEFPPFVGLGAMDEKLVS